MNQLLVLSEILMIWAVATASGRVDMLWNSWGDETDGMLLRLKLPASRAILAAVAVVVVLWSWNGAGLAVVTALGVLVAFWLRQTLSTRRFLAEAELLSLIGFISVASGLIWYQRLEVGFPWLQLPVDTSRLAFTQLAVFALIISIWHSGNLVFGMLSKEGVLPDKQGDKATLRHGMLIGYLERLLIVVLVAQGSYEGLGFLIAAKGLIRSKELTEDRELVEYFLVGSLLSILCAVSVALFIRFAFSRLW